MDIFSTKLDTNNLDKSSVQIWINWIQIQDVDTSGSNPDPDQTKVYEKKKKLIRQEFFPFFGKILACLNPDS